MNFLGPKYHISGNYFMHYLQSQIISFCHSHENNPRTVHASSNPFFPGPLLSGECCRVTFSIAGLQNQMGPCDYGTYNQKRSSRILFLQHLMISLVLQLVLFTAEGDH